MTDRFPLQRPCIAPPVWVPAIANAAVTAIAAFAMAIAQAAVVRCTGDDGRITYQDVACPTSAQTIAVDETPNRGFRFADPKDVERLRRERAAARARDDAYENARPAVIRATSSGRRKAARVAFNAGERRFIMAGTPVSEVHARIGKPDRIERPLSRSSPSRPSTAKSAVERWFYLPAEDDPQTTTILSVKGNVVALVDRRVTR